MTDHPRNTDIRLAFRSGEFATRQAIASVLSGLQHLRLPQDVTGTTELILAEVLNNIVEHAYGPETHGRIELTCVHRMDGLYVGVTDYGKPMPGGQLPEGRSAVVDCALQDMPEGGFGWYLVQELARDVTYRHRDGQNILTLRIPIALAPVPGETPEISGEYPQ